MLQIVCRIMEAIVPRAFPICVSVQVQVRMGYIHFIFFMFYVSKILKHSRISSTLEIFPTQLVRVKG